MMLATRRLVLKNDSRPSDALESIENRQRKSQELLPFPAQLETLAENQQNRKARKIA